MRKSKERGPLVIWTLTKIIFLPLWIWLGVWVGSKAGLAGLIPFALVIGLYQISDFWNQYLISKTAKALKRQIDEESLQGKERERNLKKVWQLEVKRSFFTALPYFFKRTGFKRTPRYSYQEELLDFAPAWIKEHILKSMALLSPVAFWSFLPPLKATIKGVAKNDKVFLGLDIGCGYGGFIEMLARWCQKEKLPAIFFGVENQANIIKGALRRMKSQNSFEVLMHSDGKVNTSDLVNKAKKNKGPIVYLIFSDAISASRFFDPNTITLTQIVHAKHHFENIMESVERISKHWIILEECRTWPLLLVLYSFYWCVSRVLTCDGEDSILAMHTPKEWRAKGVKIVSKFPFFLWAISDSLYSLLKEERVIK